MFLDPFLAFLTGTIMLFLNRKSSTLETHSARGSLYFAQMTRKHLFMPFQMAKKCFIYVSFEKPVRCNILSQSSGGTHAFDLPSIWAHHGETIRPVEDHEDVMSSSSWVIGGSFSEAFGDGRGKCGDYSIVSAWQGVDIRGNSKLWRRGKNLW